MRDILNWVLDNSELVKDILKLALSLATFVYAYVIHAKSKKRLTELEAKDQAKTDLLKSLQDLKEALEERNKKDGKEN